MIDRHKMHLRSPVRKTTFEGTLCGIRTSKFETDDPREVTCTACLRLYKELKVHFAPKPIMDELAAEPPKRKPKT